MKKSNSLLSTFVKKIAKEKDICISKLSESICLDSNSFFSILREERCPPKYFFELFARACNLSVIEQKELFKIMENINDKFKNHTYRDFEDDSITEYYLKRINEHMDIIQDQAKELKKIYFLCDKQKIEIEKLKKVIKNA